MATEFHEPPQWVRDAVFYQIFPDRFARSGAVHRPGRLQPWDDPPTFHGFKGGDLIGIVDKLDHLRDLGITAIYLNPIFASTANHRYHTHDYFAVDPLLGDDDAFDRMLAACHDAGIRVVLDGVFNHSSRSFLQFANAAENGPESPYWDWFHIREWPVYPYDLRRPANYEAWWGNKALPKFNTDNPDVREHLMSAVEHWTRRGIDGWRLDVPNEITTEGFWEEFRTRVRAINPDAYIVGEIWSFASDWVDDGTRFDATMNYPLGTAIIAFAGGSDVDLSLRAGDPAYDITPIDAPTFADRVRSILDRYSERTTLANLNLLDSHDTARVTSIMRENTDRIRLAAALQMTFPGAPCVYYGTEVGLPGGLDPDCRRGFPWDEQRWNTDLLDAYRSLIRLRHDHAALRSPRYEIIHAAGLEFAARRHGPDGSMMIAVNAGQAPAALPVGAAGRVVWGDAHVDERGVSLGPLSAAVLQEA